MKKINCIIDTDPGADDCVANLIATHHKKLNILLFTTVAGNVEIEFTTRNLLHSLEVLNKNIPVAKGANKPLKREYKDARYIHTLEGMGGYLPKTPKTKVIKKSAVEAMYETIKENKNDIVIFALGPQTNLAKLIKKHPDVKEMISKIYFMGASGYGENPEFNHISFNIRSDPEAFSIVYNSKIPMAMIPSEIGRATYMNLDQVKQLQNSKKFGKYLYDMMIGYKEPGFDEHRSAMNDTATILLATNPKIFKTKKITIDINLKDAPGKTIFTYDKEGYVERVVSFNKQKFHKEFFKLLKEIDNEK